MLILSTGGRIGFACRHGYPHSSKIAIPTVLENLKGLDMLVYQALRRLSRTVHVRAFVHFERSEWDESTDSEGSSQSEAVPPVELCYLSKLEGVVFGHDYDQDRQTTADELGFPRKKVIWLNGRPGTFTELAAVCVAVRDSSYSMASTNGS
jgi:hypothetical protein